MSEINFQFDGHQRYQLDAIEAICTVFNGSSHFSTVLPERGIFPNLPSEEQLDTFCLAENLHNIQSNPVNHIPEEARIAAKIDFDEGFPHSWVGRDPVRYHSLSCHPTSTRSCSSRTS